MTTAELELLIVIATLVLTIVFTIIVFGIAKELNLGIFRRFFKLLIAAAVVSVLGRGIVLLQVSGRVTTLPPGIDLLTGLLFFILLTAAFWLLLTDWKKVSLKEPVRGGAGRASQH